MSANGPKKITGRELRRSTPGGRLVPGEFVVAQKQGGKVFEHKRKEVQPRSILKALDQLLEDIPNPGEPVRTNLARIFIEDRE